MASLSLSKRQSDVVSVMLNLNRPVEDADDKGTPGEPQWSSDWKVLVYDKFCRDIISPLLNVAALRRLGVTLHMLVDADRDAIPDVPAVYFVQPTEENIARIARDCGDGLYEKVYLNFSSPLPRPLLESLARATLQNSGVAQIAKLHDQYLNFVTLEPRLFTLNQPTVYATYSNPTTHDTAIGAALNAVAQSLFSVFVCLGAPPVIKCPPSEGPAAMVATVLDGMLRDYLARAKGVFGAGGAVQRPTLILLDRDVDLAVALHHTISYQALVDDLLGLNLRRVSIPVLDADGRAPTRGPRTHVYDLDPDTDPFWRDHAASHFPDAIAAQREELAAVEAKEAEVRRTATVSEEEVKMEMEEAAALGSQSLVQAVDSLPALLQRKDNLVRHTNVQKAVMNVVASRHVPVFFEAEVGLDSKTVLELLRDTTKGSFNDKVRLASVFLLSSPSGPEHYDELKSALTAGAGPVGAGAVRLDDAGAGAGAGAAGGAEAAGGVTPPTAAELEDGLAVLEYVKSHRRVANLVSGGGGGAGGAGAGAGAGAGDVGSQWLASVAGHASKMLTKAAQSVKTLVSGKDLLPVTRVVRAVCEPRAHAEVDTYRTLDPKISARASSTTSSGPGSSGGGGGGSGSVGSSFAVVFVIGGGCYQEYLNVQKWAGSTTPPTTVLYGATDMLRPEAFLGQLAELGRGAPR